MSSSVVGGVLSGTPFSLVDSTVDADRNNIALDPLPAGTYSGVGPNAVTVENKGGRNGAVGPGSLQIDLRAGYRLRTGGSKTAELFAEIFNVTNEPNFANPTTSAGFSDRRLGTFLTYSSLAGGGFPRQFQIGMRFGF